MHGYFLTAAVAVILLALSAFAVKGLLKRDFKDKEAMIMTVIDTNTLPELAGNRYSVFIRRIGINSVKGLIDHLNMKSKEMGSIVKKYIKIRRIVQYIFMSFAILFLIIIITNLDNYGIYLFIYLVVLLALFDLIILLSILLRHSRDVLSLYDSLLKELSTQV